MRFLFSLAACVGVLAASGAALAQGGSTDPGALLREETLQLKRQEEFERAPGRPPLPPLPHLGSSPADISEDGPVIDSPDIRLDVPEALAYIDWTSVLDSYRRLPLGQKRLQLLIRQLNGRLVKHGLITTGAAVREVDIDGRFVRIEIIPGLVEAFSNQGAPLADEIRAAFPLKEGDVLRLSDLEQGIHQINRLRLYRAEARILPGQAPGASVVDFSIREGSWWHASVGVDNLGNSSTGVARLRANLNLDNRLGLLDSIALVTVVSERSRTLLASLAVPDGYNTWSMTAYGSRYRQTIPGDFKQSGTSSGLTLALNRVLSLSAEGRDSFDLAVTRTAGRRKLEEIALQPDDLTVLRASLSRVRRHRNLQWYVEGAAGLGLSAFGARKDDSNLVRTDVHGQFEKVELHAGLSWQPQGASWQYALKSDAQYSRVSLYGSEQLGMTGMAALRGFDDSLLFVDRGLLLRHEIRLPAIGREDQATGVFSPYLLFDHARGALVGQPSVHLSSAGFGVRWSSRRASGELVAAHPLRMPSGFGKRDARIHFTLNVPL